MSSVGQSVLRIDARSKVTGEAQYPGDINLPNQAYMKILFARRPHALIKRIGTTKAEEIAGVIAIFTARDVPVNEYGLNVRDQPVLCGPGSKIPGADRVRFIGDQVALVVAETEEIAAKACDLIEVDYEDLPVISDPVEAIKPDAYLLHLGKESNIFCHYQIRKGDMEAGFALADVIVEEEYHTPGQEHAFLQPEAGLSYIDEEDRVTVLVAGQWIHEDQDQIAHALDLPPDRVRVIYPAIGGAFGGREDMSVQIVLALAALRLHQRGIDRPVKIIWSREESIIGHHKRHPYIIKAKWGATREGKVVAAQVNLLADGGAYTYTSTKVLGNATLMCTGPYEIPHVSVDSNVVFTNNIPTGAFRGFGGPQGLFAAESQMNKLAEVLGIDPVELRMRNVLRNGSLLSVGTPLPGEVTLTQVAEQCAEAGGWKKTGDGWVKPDGLQIQDDGALRNPAIKRGRGFALGFKNVGFSFGAVESCWAKIELKGAAEIEQVVLYHGGADVGQGAHTVFVQMAAEALGLPPTKVRLVASDTATSGNSGSASASRMTYMAGNAIRGAAKIALDKWKNEERPAIGQYEYHPPATTMFDPQTGYAKPNFAYGYVAEIADVEVDVETGQVHLLNVICTNDVGKAINPDLVKGQVEGAIVQAEGYTLLENLVQKDSYCLTPGLSTYLIPTIVDVPDQVETHLLEYADEGGPFGARGMGEMPLLPLAPAITAAVHAATGVWVDSFPLTPERVLNALKDNR